MRALLFCNEMLGLGHLRRSLLIGGALAKHGAGGASLVVTGSPAFGGMRTPAGVDILKLPTAPVTKESRWSATAFRPASGLPIAAGDIWTLRAQLALTAAERFAPDVVISDQRPLGREGELQPALELLRGRGGCAIVLGLWDVDDDRRRLDREWREDLMTAVARLYDLAIVYGSPAPGDLRIERLEAARLQIHHTSLVGMASAHQGPADLGNGYLLALVGGGVDGFAVLSSVIDAIRAKPLDSAAVLVTGPFMAPREVADLRTRASGLDIHVVEFRSDMDAVIGGARAIVAMAGYCTVAEIVASGKPALLVPRAFPREEQLNRARRLAASGRVTMIEPAQLDSTAMRDALSDLLARPAAAPQPLTGASEVARLLGDGGLPTYSSA